MFEQGTQDIYSLEKLQEVWRRGQRFPFVFFHAHSEDDVICDPYNSTCCTQWFPCEFIDETGRKYNCCEQYMMAQKAILFNDRRTLKKILECSDPRTIKKYGREVKRFDQVKWDENCQEIVFHGNLLKFTQNEKFRNFLLSVPKNAIFVEATSDGRWGIRFKEKNPKSQDPLKWGGTNFLGFQITRVRDFIVSQNIM